MGTTPNAKISILLNGGINNRADPELVAPVIATGSSPDLLSSLNTRLSVVPNSVVRSPGSSPVDNTIPAGSPCYGIVPCQAGNAAAAFFSPAAGGTRQLQLKQNGYTAGNLRSAATQQVQSVYRPVQIAQAGAIPSSPAYSHITTTYDASAGRIWYAYLVSDLAVSGNSYVYAYCTDTTGTALCSPVRVTASLALTVWCGLTAHGANGVSVWYVLQGGALTRATLTLSGNLVGVGAAGAVYSPGNTASAVDVVRISDTYAAIVSSRAGGAADGVLIAWSIPGGFVQSAVTYAGAMTATAPGSFSYCAVYADTLAGVINVAATFSSVTSGLTTLAGTTFGGGFSTAWAAYTVAGFGTVAVKFLVTLGSSFIAFARSPFQGSFGAGTGTQRTIVTVVARATGVAPGADIVLPWLNLANHGAQVTHSAAEMYPLFFLARCYGELAGPTLPTDYVDDPSVEGYLVTSATAAASCAAVARFGVVRGTVAPARVMTSYEQLANCTTVDGTQVYVAYRKDNFQKTYASLQGYYGRYVVLDFGSRQPSIVQDRDGTALFAAALPAQFDGVEVTEMGGPLHSPHLAMATTGGTGAALPAGVYVYKAVYQWTDAAGLEHRSRPSNQFTITSAGTAKPVARVTLPDSLRDGVNLGPVSILLYASLANAPAAYYLLTDAPTAVSTLQVTYGAVSAADSSGQQLYSATGAGGEEIFPQPPAPMHDIAVVGSRVYAIDAEIRSRLIASKIRIAGKGFEFAPALEINFPSSAGRLMAVREFNGIPIILAENGCYQLSGDGPSNTGVGQFSSPVFLSDFGCSNHDSVVRYPGGLLWQKGNYIAKFDGGQVATFKNVLASDTYSCTSVFKNQDEVLFFTASRASIQVYNYAFDRWTTWDDRTRPEAIKCAVAVPTDADRVLFYEPVSGVLGAFDALSTSAALNMLADTSWFVPGGDFQDHTVVRELVFSARAMSPHDLTIELFTNYSDTPYVLDWPWAKLDALAENSTGRYTVSFTPVEINTRAMRVRVRDTLLQEEGTEGFRPIALTIVTALEQTDSLVNELAIQDGSRQ